jgi:enamine deaminase RidA (YjgF/YER057c/UK114 family)
VFVSGLTARGTDGNIVGEGDIRAQTRQVFENLKRVLAESGATLSDVVRVVQYVRDMADHGGMTEIKREYLGDHRPASTTVQIARLFDERQLIEIEATAIVGAER